MLNRIADGIWTHDHEIKLPGGLRLPSRATIMRAADGGLVVHSPLSIDDATAREIDALGEVRVLVAPNCGHWMFLKAAKERYPRARVLAASGLANKLGNFEFEPLADGGRIDGVEDLRFVRIQGAPKMDEHAFFHEASRSLVVSDLMFNVHSCESFAMSLVLRLTGTWKKTAQSRVWRFLVKDHAAAARSAEHVLSWDFERVVVAHGDVIEGDARAQTRHALRWMTSGAPRLLGAGSVLT
ncbi:MAG TPA: hypothetical protein VM580_12665 [Labilithrix sp.]|nr:hypothetical protein [Labilithrix sp.]